MLLRDGPVENMFISSAYWINERWGGGGGQLRKFNLHKVKIIVVPILTLGGIPVLMLNLCELDDL